MLTIYNQPTIEMALKRYEEEPCTLDEVNSVKTRTSEAYLKEAGSLLGYTGEIEGGNFRFPKMKQTRYDFEFYPDYVLMKLSPNGFFQTATGNVSLKVLSPYYFINSATYEIVHNKIRLFLKPKKGYSYEDVAKIFAKLTSNVIPEVDKEEDVLPNLPDEVAYIATIVNTPERKFILARKADKNEVRWHVSLQDAIRSHRDFYLNDHVITGKTTHLFLCRFIADNMFGIGNYVILKDRKSDGYLLLSREECEFCQHPYDSDSHHMEIREVCDSCYEHIKGISILLKILGENKSPELRTKVKEFKDRLNAVNEKVGKKK